MSPESVEIVRWILSAFCIIFGAVALFTATKRGFVYAKWEKIYKKDKPEKFNLICGVYAMLLLVGFWGLLEIIFE